MPQRGVVRTDRVRGRPPMTLSFPFKQPPMVDATSGARAWLFDGSATAVCQITSPVMTLDAVKFWAETIDGEIHRRWADAGRKTRFLHEWSSATEYEPAARDLMIAWGRRGGPFTRETILHLSPNLSTFVRIAVNTGISIMRLSRMNIHLEPDVTALVNELSRE